MNRLSIATQGICSWKSRLASPEGQWKREYSAMETAISWEIASKRKSGYSTSSGLPGPIEKLFEDSIYGQPELMTAIAEHKVELPGGNADSQCDVWAIVKTSAGLVSLTVKAKANEDFGGDILEKWMVAGKTPASQANRKQRAAHILAHLPQSNSFSKVRYQLLHRCAAAVIEAKRYGFGHAAFVVQAFHSTDKSFQDYTVFCNALNISAAQDGMATTSVNGISLSIGWANFPFATDDGNHRCKLELSRNVRRSLLGGGKPCLL